MVCEAPIRSGPYAGLSATGTEAGYARHRRRREQACDACREGVTRRVLARRDPEAWDAYMKKWRSENKDLMRNSHRIWAKANPEKMAANNARRVPGNAERLRVWREANRERSRANGRRGEARRRAWAYQTAVSPFTEEQLAARLSMFAGCWMCGGPADSVDHVKPLSAGGAHVLANLRPACLPCNKRKNAKWPYPTRRVAP